MLSCPYCNSILPQAVESSGSRIVCSRCGESFVPKDTGNTLATASEMPVAASSANLPSRGSPRILLALALLIIGGVGAYLLLKDKSIAPDSTPKEDSARRPSEWSAPGYLPENVDLVAGVQPGAWADFWNKNSEAIAATQRQLGISDAWRETLAASVPFSKEEIDTGVLGVRFNPLALFVVLHLKQSANLEERIRNQKFKVARSGSRVFFELLPEGKQLPLVFHQPSERIIVAALTIGDFDGVPVPGANHLRPALREQLEKSPPGTLFWLALQRDSWDDMQALLKLSPKLLPFAAMLKRLQEVAALRMVILNGESPLIQVAIECKTDSMGDWIRDLLREKIPADGGVKMSGEACEIQLEFEMTAERLAGILKLLPPAK